MQHRPSTFRRLLLSVAAIGSIFSSATPAVTPSVNAKGGKFVPTVSRPSGRTPRESNRTPGPGSTASASVRAKRRQSLWDKLLGGGSGSGYDGPARWSPRYDAITTHELVQQVGHWEATVRHREGAPAWWRLRHRANAIYMAWIIRRDEAALAGVTHA